MKKVYLKSWLENLLITIEFLIIGFIGTTIETMGNSMYDKILLVVMIIFIINAIVLLNFGKSIIEANK